ncbi:carbohydrate ABC transporter permease [Spirochaeta thermophila]|uniref:Transporter n=1 Tax=Winmispira thermophila (strain ATCC 49972 / DSM 6192 / RI 19.B1) TaxID=665571 RepID=E0RU09_WINT6|nr:sugar ABC transporter permease [Spirochaeta thermophila]ADN01065.1 transporter [Spirochaeta thermophila DSM 6192]
MRRTGTVSRLLARRNRMGYLYILPWVIGFLFLQVFPIAYSFYISLTKWDLLGTPSFVGWENFRELLEDEVFFLALRNNLIFMIFGVGGGLLLSLFMAALISEPELPGRRFFRVLFFLPSLVMPVALGLMMAPIFGTENYGLINLVLKKLGLGQVEWLGDPGLAIWSVVIVNFWTVGASMIIFLAGITNLPRSYYEAAAIDGAGWWTRLFRITVPLLSPVLLFQLISGLIYGLRIFDLPAALANIGGSRSVMMGKDNSLAFLVFYLYTKAFRYWEMGSAAAIGWVVFLVGFALTVVIIRYMRGSSEEGGV